MSMEIIDVFFQNEENIIAEEKRMKKHAGYQCVAVWVSPNGRADILFCLVKKDNPDKCYWVNRRRVDILENAGLIEYCDDVD